MSRRFAPLFHLDKVRLAARAFNLQVRVIRDRGFTLPRSTASRLIRRRRGGKAERNMSIVTRTGDSGTTALMYNRRVSKCDARIEACGTVDELNAALGVVRAAAGIDDRLGRQILAIQKDLVTLMGELATAPEDLDRYVKDGYSLVTGAMTDQLEALVREVESERISFKGWATPGATGLSAALDVARTICRRAERRVCALREAEQLRNSEIIVFLNRLSDTLWLLARRVETHHTRPD